jgi:NhaA family Na+:H+ antiporter
MSLFIAGQAFPDPADYAAAKIAIFIASLIAGVLGTIILYPRRQEDEEVNAKPASTASTIRPAQKSAT